MLAQPPSQRAISIRKRSADAEFLGHPPGKDAPEEIFERLAAQFTDYLKPDRFRASWIEMKLPMGDPELDRLLSAATKLGLRLPRHSGDQPCQISIRDYLGFTADEIDMADFVECQRFNPFIVCSSEKASSDLTRIASNQYIKQCRNREIGAFVNLYHLLAVRGGAKTTLESAGLKGLELLPLIPDSGGWPPGIDPLYLVWSSTRLPSLSGELVLDGDFQIVPQLRYNGLDLSEIDIAITNECFGSSPHYHRIVYSQRARQALESIDSELQYRPVFTKAEQDVPPNP
jgi:hypothetical protein